MDAQKDKAWPLISSSLRILKAHHQLIIPVMFSRLFKFALAILIISPLIRAYSYESSLGGVIHFLENMGINLKGPIIYLILTVILFITYTFSTLVYSIALSSLLESFRTQTYSLRAGTRNVLKKLPSLLSWCLINKTIGLAARAWDALINLLPIEHPSLKAYNWQTSTALSLTLIIDQNIQALEAVKRSKNIIEKNWGANSRFSLKFLKFTFFLLFISSLPFLLGLVFYTKEALWIGSLLSLICWYFVSILNSILSLIVLSAFYEYVANHKVVVGFDEGELKGLLYKYHCSL